MAHLSNPARMCLIIAAPSFEGIIKTSRGKAFLRTKFRIWPGRGGVLETTLKEEMVASLKELDPNYSEWMVAVTMRLEKKEIPLAFRDFPQKKN